VTTVLRACEVTKVYGGTHALKGVDFDVAAGRVTALCGENGAGKSTLMKILAGIEQPTTGHVELDGRITRHRSARDAADHGIAIIHQELNLCPNLSVEDNLFLAREIRRRTGTVNHTAQRAGPRRSCAAWRSGSTPSDPSPTCAWASNRSSRSPAPCCRTPACSSWTNPPPP
jgi:erythritol transport system ATP-binding protein